MRTISVMSTSIARDAPEAAARHVEGCITIRVRYVECDAMGVAHHASYFPWLEMGRTELLRDRGVSYRSMEQSGVFLVVTGLQIRYRRPVKYDDLIEVRTRVEEVGPVRIRHAYRVMLKEREGSESDASVPADGVLAVASSELACVDAAGRPRPLPPILTRGT